VYAHKPGWYMMIDEGQRDVIDKSTESGFLDLNGTDIFLGIPKINEKGGT
jgi:hypothetical protein